MQHLLIHLDYSALMFHPIKTRKDGIKERKHCERNIKNRSEFLDFYAHFKVGLFSLENIFMQVLSRLKNS